MATPTPPGDAPTDAPTEEPTIDLRADDPATASSEAGHDPALSARLAEAVREVEALVAQASARGLAARRESWRDDSWAAEGAQRGEEASTDEVPGGGYGDATAATERSAWANPADDLTVIQPLTEEPDPTTVVPVQPVVVAELERARGVGPRRSTRPKPPSATPRTRTALPSVPAAAGWGLLTAGGVLLSFVVFLLLLSGLSHARAQAQLTDDLRRDLSLGQAPVGGDIAEGTPVAMLEIPRLGLSEVVVEGTDRHQLQKGPGHLRSSALPGQAGRSVIFGRRVTYGAPFADLGSLESGDEVVLTTAFGEVRYEVQEVERVAAGEPDVIEGPGRTLVLATLDGSFRPKGRLVVTASLVGDAAPTPPGRPNSVGRDEDGLRGMSIGWLGLLGYGQLLALVVIAGVRAGRTRRWTAWIIAVPIALMMLHLAFDSADLLLPATL